MPKLATAPRRWGLGLTLLLFASCTTPEPASDVSSTVVATTTPADIPASPTTSGSTQTFTLGANTSAAEEPGRYQVFFDPPFTLTIPEGWRGEALSDDFVFFEWTGGGFEGDSPPLVAVQVFDFMVDPADRDEGAVFPDDLRSFIATHQALAVGQQSEATLAGQSAVVIDADILETNVDDDQPRLEFGFTPDGVMVWFAARSEIRFLLLDVDGTEVVVTVETRCCDQLTEFLPIAEELLATLKFESLVTATTAAPEIDDRWVEVRPLGSETEFWPFSVAASDAGFLILGMVDPFGEGAPFVLFSSEGESWEAVEPPPRLLGLGAAGVGEVLVAVGEADGGIPIWVTVDGLQWNSVEGDQLEDYIFEAVGVGSNGFVALGDRFETQEDGVGIGTGEVWSWQSPDGLTWVRSGMLAESDTPLGPRAIGVAATSRGWVAIGEELAPEPSAVAWISEDGSTWTRIADEEGLFLDAEIHAIAAGSATVVAVGERYGEPQVWISDSGEVWQSVTGHGVEGFIVDVAATPSGFVAVGGGPEAGRVWESTDGLSWTTTWELEPGASPIAIAVKDDEVVVVGFGTEFEVLVLVRHAANAG